MSALESYDTGIRRCAVCTRRYTVRTIEQRGHGWCDCGGGLQYIAGVDPNPRANHDPGGEDDWRGPRILLGQTLCYWPRRWFEETPARPLPDHDPGDEDPWQPLSELSRARLSKQLGL